MIKVLRIFLVIVVAFSVYSQGYSQNAPLKEFKAKPVTIKGRIMDYLLDFKTGRLTHFDAVTRTPKDEVFGIDSTGNFEVTFNMIHEVYGCVILSIQDQSYDLYVEPEKTYSIQIKNNNIEFTDSEDRINEELSLFESAVYNQYKVEIEKARFAHNENYTIDEYVEIQKDIEQKKLSFLKDYQLNHRLMKTTIEILQNNIRYSTARAWICMRYDYGGKQPVLRDSLPERFYSRIFSEYPINIEKGYMAREYIDYIANIADVMDKSKRLSTNERIIFYKTFNYFSEQELELIARAYNRDTTVFQSDEFKKFSSNKDKINQESELKNRLIMKSVLGNSSELPKGIGRDFDLSQAIAQNYFRKDFSPTEKEWETYANFFSNKSILRYLKSISPSNKKVIVSKTENRGSNQTAEYSKSVGEKYFRNHYGKVIYVDFWATWCGPCKQEIPFAKMLHAEFKDKNVVFINFCVKSEEPTWKKLIADEKIDGENYLLNEDEFNILSQKFGVKGFPTFILIDKKGNVVNYSAPRPSSKQEIKDAINALLK